MNKAIEYAGWSITFWNKHHKSIVFVFFVVAIIACSQAAMMFAGCRNDIIDTLGDVSTPFDHLYDKWKANAEMVSAFGFLWAACYLVKSVIAKIFGWIIVTAAYNQLMDEWVYDPFAKTIFEYYILPSIILLASIVIIHRHIKRNYVRRKQP